jgi:hypothetical protein
MSRMNLFSRLVSSPRVRGYGIVDPSDAHGRILLSYLAGPLKWTPGDRRFDGHSNRWESAQIARLFAEMGYTVDAIDWDDRNFTKRSSYAGIFDIHANLERYADSNSVKMVHLTGSNLRFSNTAAQQRLDWLQSRRGVRLIARRNFPEKQIVEFERNFNVADVISLIGNEVTRSTYPEDLRSVIRLLPVTGSSLASVRSPEKVKFGREFLWFGGAGAVHKGLDLTLEAFAASPSLVLHVIGPYENERDFVKTYSKELYGMPNIKSHGYIDPSSPKFREITKGVIGHVFPSCSEGTSPAAVTCMQYGFLPIISVNTGVDLSPDMGILLKDCSIPEIANAVEDVASMDRKGLVEMLSKSQEYALTHFSRESFRKAMSDHLIAALDRIPT